jgi:hypothetical protein
MPGPSDFRKHAAECMARSQRALNEAARTAWLEMAQYWLEYSDKMGRRSRDGEAAEADKATGGRA